MRRSPLSSRTILRVPAPRQLPAVDPQVRRLKRAHRPAGTLGEPRLSASQELYDLGLNFIRPSPLANVQGRRRASPPTAARSVEIHGRHRPEPALRLKHLSATDVLDSPSTSRTSSSPPALRVIGDREFVVKLKLLRQAKSPRSNDLPNPCCQRLRRLHQGCRSGPRKATPCRRMSSVRNGKRSCPAHRTQRTVKHLAPSTSSPASRPRLSLGSKPACPTSLTITPLFDQSVFVRDSISEVAREAAIAAVLTGLMILLFLGSWRIHPDRLHLHSPLRSRPRSSSSPALNETINVMTLGGLALAVGILVDDATVEIENTHRNMAEKKPLSCAPSSTPPSRSPLPRSSRPSLSASSSFRSYCSPAPQSILFTPLAMAVVFAMLASYFLSRTHRPYD